VARAALRGRLTWQVADLVDRIDETPQVRSLVLEVPGWPGHQPGQHVDVRLTAADGYQAERSYSIATPADDNRVTITVERIDDGEVSPYLVDELQVGDKLELRGPIGGYFVWQPSDGGPLFLAAGGSGLVPLMAMVRARVRDGGDVPVRLLVSSRSADDVIYRDELGAVAAGHDGVEVVQTLTRAQPPGWSGYRRRVDREMLADIAWRPTDKPRCYVCGPTGFVEAVATALVELGHQPQNIRTERFGPTGGEP
jgi:ferredoxin-NADP reductase